MLGMAMGGDDALLKAKRQKKEAEEAAKAKDSPDGTPAGNAASGSKSEEVKKDDKDASKQAVKEEEEEDEDATDAFNDIMEAQTSGKKRTRREFEASLPEMPEVETDTEYSKVDLSGFPGSLRIEGSSYERLNGLYRKFGSPSRGRPAYVKISRGQDKKNLYMFWIDHKWQIGFEFGQRKCIANIADAKESIEPPFEPFPGVWKVLEKHKDKDKDEERKQEKVDCLQLRVIDSTIWNDSHEIEDLYQPYEAHAEQAYLAKEAERAERAEKKRLAGERKSTREAEDAAKPSASPKKTSSASKNLRKSPKKARASSLNGSKQTGDDEADLVEAAAAANNEDSDDDPKANPRSSAPSAPSDSNESVSDSDSEESSSSESSEASEPEDDTEVQEMNLTARNLVSKLRGMTKNEATGKAMKLFSQLRTRMRKGLGSHPDLDTKNVDLLRAWCRRHLQITLPEVSPALYTAHQAQASDRSQPQTPPQELAASRETAPSAQMPHRTEQPKKSVLRRGGPRNTRKISFQPGEDMDKPCIMEHKIESFKAEGERLWHHQPGAVVQCDLCHKPVPQQMGVLQGAANRSQFAQSMFVCSECSRNPPPPPPPR